MDREQDGQNPVLMWYGKIPSMGDFVRRRMPEQILLPWERWFSSGISQARVACRQGSLPGTGAALPQAAWGFVLPQPQGGAQAGAVVPSQDRVGRDYMVCALVTIDPEQCHTLRLPVLAGMVEQLGLSLVQGLRFCWAATQLDQTLCRCVPPSGLFEPHATAVRHDAGRDILDVLYGTQDAQEPAQDIWSVLQPCLEPGSHRSYWWRLGMNHPSWASVTHSADLTPALFRRLFASASDVRPFQR
ncbi:MAG TPA: type VI secretion system-associated protein TagF [Alcaligenes sp.]|nr:type VI secretion system-associated protein TagF [Alcaligenes sp.]HRL26095.1 type VI secretion system-associated protein TagF [Alcaligenes sp.]